MTDAQGKTASDTVEIEVTGGSSSPPSLVEVNADRTSGVAPHLVWFEAVAEDADDAQHQLVYRWEFGDDEVAYGSEAEHTYTEPGTYTATVTVTDPAGGSDSDTVEITVAAPQANRAPTVQAGALPASGKAPLDVVLTAQGSDPDGDALTYSWEFGDGSTAKGRRARHTYTAVGTYQAKVTVDDGESTGTATVQIVVGDPAGNQAPTVQAAADPSGGGTAPLKVGFCAAGVDPDGDPLSYVWDFGDGGMAGGTKATHTYTAPGTYVAKVTVTDPSGATGPRQITVQVRRRGGAGREAGRGAVQAAFRAVGSPTLEAFTRRGLQGSADVRRGQHRAGDAGDRPQGGAALGLTGRRLASATVRCGDGGRVDGALERPPGGEAQAPAGGDCARSARPCGCASPARTELRHRVTLRPRADRRARGGGAARQRRRPGRSHAGRVTRFRRRDAGRVELGEALPLRLVLAPLLLGAAPLPVAGDGEARGSTPRSSRRCRRTSRTGVASPWTKQCPGPPGSASSRTAASSAPSARGTQRRSSAPAVSSGSSSSGPSTSTTTKTGTPAGIRSREVAMAGRTLGSPAMRCQAASGSGA